MSFRSIVYRAIRKSLAFSIGLFLVLGGAPGVFAQSSTAAIAGVILDPAGKPAAGFKVTVRDIGSNTLYTSGPTDAAGKYSVNVPVGGRYKVDNVLAADGVTKLAVQDVAPVSVLAAGTTPLNVQFTTAPPTTAVAGAAAGAAAGSAATSTTPPAGTQTASNDKKKDKGAVPWYKKPGPIVGMVLGGAAIIALAASGGGDDNSNNASPSTP